MQSQNFNVGMTSNKDPIKSQQLLRGSNKNIDAFAVSLKLEFNLYSRLRLWSHRSELKELEIMNYN